MKNAPAFLGPFPDQQTKKKAPCRRKAANYTALLRISKGVRPFIRSIRS